MEKARVAENTRLMHYYGMSVVKGRKREPLPIRNALSLEKTCLKVLAVTTGYASCLHR